MHHHARQIAAFSRLELLVVIAIVVLLVALLIPAIGNAHSPHRIGETTAMLMGLSHSIDTYFTVFNEYPGPADPTITTATKDKISGNQNLLLGLCYSMGTSNAAPNIPLPHNPLSVDPTSPAGPRDLGPASRSYPPFSSFSSDEISAATGTPPTWPPAGIAGAAAVGNNFAFPTILDRFSDALPILYYRRSHAASTPRVVDAAATENGTYNYRENAEYTTAADLRSASGVVYDQIAGPSAPFTPVDLAALVAIHGAANPRGSYVLISAGPDRYYGSKNGKSDNIVVFGGP